jgi:hypothetical protein
MTEKIVFQHPANSQFFWLLLHKLNPHFPDKIGSLSIPSRMDLRSSRLRRISHRVTAFGQDAPDTIFKNDI